MDINLNESKITWLSCDTTLSRCHRVILEKKFKLKTERTSCINKVKQYETVLSFKISLLFG